MNTTLIQLVSEQTMQNLLPILALRPPRVVHLATPRFAVRSVHSVEAARRLGVQTEFRNARLTEMPGIAETAQAVYTVCQAAIQAGEQPVVNFTGGTKMMSIGAYAAAAKQHVPAFYVDTEHHRFVDAAAGAEPIGRFFGENLSTDAAAASLTVSAVAIANGCAGAIRGRDPESWLPLARHLMNAPGDEDACWTAMHGAQGLFPGGREPRGRDDWRRFAGMELNLPLHVHALLPHGAPAAAGADRFVLPGDIDHLRALTQMLAGGWWEVAVYDAANRSGVFHELLWSAMVGGGTAGGGMEEDVIGLDGAQVAYVSCKRGGSRAKLLPLLNEIHARAERIGGRFTRKFLAVYKTPSSQVARDLEPRAKALGIRIVYAADMADPAVFADARMAATC